MGKGIRSSSDVNEFITLTRKICDNELKREKESGFNYLIENYSAEMGYKAINESILRKG